MIKLSPFSRITALFACSLLFFEVQGSMFFDTTTVDFQDIVCGQSIAGNTTGAENDFETGSYSSCFTETVNAWDAGDDLYRFELDTTTDITILLSNQDSANLDIFLLANAIVDGVPCPDTCISFAEGSDNDIEMTLDSGTYWIVVDGTIIPAAPQDIEQVGSYVLSLYCGEKNYETISCGQSVMGSTVGRRSDFRSSEYDNCYDGPIPIFGAGDQLYRLDLTQTESVEITLSRIDLALLDVFLMSNVIDPESGEACPGPCLATTATLPTNSISTVLDSGTYWLVVDGVEKLADPVNIFEEGQFLLEVNCGKSYLDAAFDQTFENTTIGAVNNFGTDDYAACIDNVVKDYGSTDLLYRLEVDELSDVMFALTPGADDLDIFIFDNDSTAQEACPGSCIANSSLIGADQVQIELDSGTYWIVIDGAVSILANGFAYDQGAFTLDIMAQSLPISLSRFDGYKQNKEVVLEWTTVSEINSEKFMVQRSGNLEDWSSLAEVRAMGFSEAVNDYQHIDRQPLTGANYYRLKMMDLDGSFEYSPVVSVSLERELEIRIYPNVTHKSVTVDFGEVPPGDFHIVDMYGKVWRTVVARENRSEIDLSDLAAGMYYFYFKDQSRALPVLKQ